MTPAKKDFLYELDRLFLNEPALPFLNQSEQGT